MNYEYTSKNQVLPATCEECPVEWWMHRKNTEEYITNNTECKELFKNLQ